MLYTERMVVDFDKLYQALDGYSQLLIIPHNDPDPDAIATSVGLRYLVFELFGIESRIGYCGIIGRAENKALVHYLNHPLHELELSEIRQDIPLALVDAQPGVGNNPLPENFPVAIVIDHHARQEASSNARFVDVRPEFGATSTIMTEYLQNAALDIPSHLATALFYGIKTDTMGLGRGACINDTEAYLFLQSKVDVEALVQIERAQVPVSYYRSLTAAMQATKLYDGDLVISYIGSMNYPDLGAEIADLLLRLNDVNLVICIGVFDGDLILSVRSRSPELGAGDLVQRIVGDLGTAGGHGTMAGGHIQINQQDPSQLSDQLSRSALQHIKGDASLVGKPLI